jgi:hypothetical protein
MPSPLEERIRELCAKAVAAQNDEQVIPQLRAAIKEYVHETRNRAAEIIPRMFRSDKDVA